MKSVFTTIFFAFALVASAMAQENNVVENQKDEANDISFIYNWETNVANVWKGFGSYRHYYSAKYKRVLTNRFSIGGLYLGAGAYYDENTGVTPATSLQLTLEFDKFKFGVEGTTGKRVVNDTKDQSFGIGLDALYFFRKLKKLPTSQSSKAAYGKHSTEKIKPNHALYKTRVAFGFGLEYNSFKHLREGDGVTTVGTSEARSNYLVGLAILDIENTIGHFVTGQVEHDVVLGLRLKGGVSNSITKSSEASTPVMQAELRIGFKF